MEKGIIIVIILTISITLSGCIFFQPTRETTTTQPTQNICELGIPRYEINQYGISTIVETYEGYVVFGEPSQGIGDIGAALILTYQTTTDPNRIIVNTLGYGRREININNYRNINCVICPFSRDRTRPRIAELTGTYDGQPFSTQVNIPLDSFGIPTPFRVNLPDGSSQTISLLAPDYIGSNNICSGYKLVIKGDKDTLNKILVVGQDACGGTSLEIYKDNNDIKQLVDNCESSILALQQTSEIIQPTEILPIEYSCEDKYKRKPDDITEESKFTRNEITIKTKRGSQTIETRTEPDICLPKHEGGWEIAEVYCNKLTGNKYDEVLRYKYLDCSEGCEDGACKPETINLGYIKISGGIDNRAFSWVPFVGRLARARGTGSINGNIPLDKEKKCGYPELDSIIKLWFHKDLYNNRYKSLIKEQKEDLFTEEEKKRLFPPNDGSYVVFIHGILKEGKLTLQSKYKKASDVPPDDLNSFDMTNAIDNSFTKNLDDPKILEKFVNQDLAKNGRELSFLKLRDAIAAILKLYAGFSGKGLSTAQGIVMVKAGDPKYEGNLLPINIFKQILTLDDNNFDQEFESKIIPMLNNAINKKEYLDKIKNSCGN